MNEQDKRDMRQMLREELSGEVTDGSDESEDTPRELTPQDKYPLVPFSTKPECPACGGRKFQMVKTIEYDRIHDTDGKSGDVSSCALGQRARYTFRRCVGCGAPLRMKYKADTLRQVGSVGGRPFYEGPADGNFSDVAGAQVADSLRHGDTFQGEDGRKYVLLDRSRAGKIAKAIITALPRFVWWVATKPEKAAEKLKGYAILGAAGFVTWLLVRNTLPVQVAMDSLRELWALAAAVLA